MTWPPPGDPAMQALVHHGVVDTVHADYAWTTTNLRST